MFEDKRKIFIISGLIALAVIIGLILWWFLSSRVQPGDQEIEPLPTINQVNPALPAAPEQASTARAEQEKNFPLGLRQLAMSFAERYGSYSSDEQIQNLRDLEPFMTANLKSRIYNDLDVPAAGAFIGYSTKALSMELVDNGGNSAKMIVGVQRTQTAGNQIQSVFNDSLALTAVKVGTEWKIDSVQWQ